VIRISAARSGLVSIAPSQLGFKPLDPAADVRDQIAWEQTLNNSRVIFRLLRTLEEFAPVEAIERDTLGFDDVDLLSASALMTVPETGGEVIAAFMPDAAGEERMIAAGIGWGGFVDRRPRIISDFLGVAHSARSLGVGSAMKRLQAAVASTAGFEEIVWTVDPLRAANARLNFGKLCAFCDHYERNRYGEAMGQSHYGGLPSDRLHITWPLTSRRVINALIDGPPPPATRGDSSPDTRLVAIPDDIDAVLSRSKVDALAWRMRVRGELEPLLATGWVITNFASAEARGRDAALVLTQPPRDKLGRPDLDRAGG
jgi:predicted GNAT superfamily acetyltransferase